jgi:hypothetical protein
MTIRGRDEAKKLMAEGRTAEAIRCYEEHLAHNDEDHEARLEYGLACLIAGHRERFLEVGMEYQPCMSPYTLQRLGGRIRTLWNEYSGSCARFAAASAIGASVAVACGCDAKPAKTDAQVTTVQEFVAPSVPPDTSTTPAPPPVVTQNDTQTPPDVVDATEQPDADEALAEKTAKKPPKNQKPPEKYIPKTRYVAVHFDDEIYTPPPTKK